MGRWVLVRGEGNSEQAVTSALLPGWAWAARRSSVEEGSDNLSSETAAATRSVSMAPSFTSPAPLASTTTPPLRSNLRSFYIYPPARLNHILLMSTFLSGVNLDIVNSVLRVRNM